MPHFLDLAPLEPATLRHILRLASDLKTRWKAGDRPRLLDGKVLAMIFEKSSTRTRISFEVAMLQLGGNATILTKENSQLGRGESPADTARTLSRYTDAIMMRCYKQEDLEIMAETGSVPVINGLTDYSHPCQVMADILTFEEHRGPITGKRIAWIGDGNNMAVSWIHAAARLGFTLSLAYPENFAPFQTVLDWAKAEGADIRICRTPQEAVAGASLINTDTWISMHDQDSPLRGRIFQPYQVNDALMALASPDALFMHCLPAKRGEEVTESVLDGPQSVIWDEAENRLHIQKAILAWCLGVG